MKESFILRFSFRPKCAQKQRISACELITYLYEKYGTVFGYEKSPCEWNTHFISLKKFLDKKSDYKLFIRCTWTSKHFSVTHTTLVDHVYSSIRTYKLVVNADLRSDFKNLSSVGFIPKFIPMTCSSWSSRFNKGGISKFVYNQAMIDSKSCLSISLIITTVISIVITFQVGIEFLLHRVYTHK